MNVRYKCKDALSQLSEATVRSVLYDKGRKQFVKWNSIVVSCQLDVLWAFARSVFVVVGMGVPCESLCKREEIGISTDKHFGQECV